MDRSTPKEVPLHNRLWVVTLCAMLVLLTGGCAIWSKSPDAAIPESSASQPVAKVIGIWKPAQGTTSNGVTSRGFAGQIMFFTNASELGAVANGEVRVYVFDDDSPIEKRHLPIHQFDFASDAWQTHLRQTTVGASYDVFIPYPNDDGKRKSCSLRVKFCSLEGTVTFSDIVRITLPGSTPRQVADSHVKKDGQELHSQEIVEQARKTMTSLKPRSAQTGEDQTGADQTGEDQTGSVHSRRFTLRPKAM